MLFEQHYLDCLSQASYVIADEGTKRAVVVDPRRDVSPYLETAEEHGLTIELVLETHFHADFLSGHLELAAATGAEIGYGDVAVTEFESRGFADGERYSLGDVTLEIRHTPGHTPESISIVVYEHADDETPYAVLTGDTMFIGDVGVLVDHDRDRFGRVAGGVTDFDGDVAEAVPLAVGKAPGFELGDSDIAVPDLRPGGGSQLKVAREKVGVEVRLEHQLDREPVLLGRLEIGRHVATGVDDDGTLRALVGDDIGGLREAIEVVLFEEHQVRPFAVSFPMVRGQLLAVDNVDMSRPNVRTFVKDGALPPAPVDQWDQSSSR